MKKPKTEYPKECEEKNEKLLKLLKQNRYPDLTAFTSEDIWKEEEDVVEPTKRN